MKTLRITFIVAFVMVLTMGLVAFGADDAHPPKTQLDGKTVVFTGILVDKQQAPLKGKTVFLFGWKDGALINIDEGKVSNPKGDSDEHGRFKIVADANFFKKHKAFVFGFFSFYSFKTSPFTVQGVVNTFTIDSTNYGKTVDLGTVTVE